MRTRWYAGALAAILGLTGFGFVAPTPADFVLMVALGVIVASWNLLLRT